MLRSIFVCGLCAVLIVPLVAVAAHQPVNSRLWTPQEIVHQRYASDFEFSPDGSMVVWVKHRPSEEKDKFVGDLYLTRLNKRDKGHYLTVQLTRSEGNDSDPVFSKDGDTIYFLSSRDDGKKLWAMSIYGGDAYSIYKNKTELSDLKRLKAHKLVFTAEEGDSLAAIKEHKRNDSTLDIEDPTRFKPVRVFAYDTETKETRRLTYNRFPIQEYAVSPHGHWMVAALTRSVHYAADAHPKPAYYLWNLQTHHKRRILASGRDTPHDFKFARDGNGFYFVDVKTSDPQWSGAGISQLYYYASAGAALHHVPLQAAFGLGRGYHIAAHGVIASLARGATDSLAYYRKTAGDQWRKFKVSAGRRSGHVDIAEVSPYKDKAVYVYSTASLLPEYRFGEVSVDGQAARLSRGRVFATVNPSLRDKATARSRVIHWRGAHGDTVDGILYYPRHYQRGQRYPLVVSIHGGPAGADLDTWHDSWAYYPNIFAQKGAFVLKPNYHGSSNHGLKFVESIKHHYYQMDMTDITRGIDALSKRGLIDKDKLGVHGWSNGAILTIAMTVYHPHLFKVAGEGAGDVDWVSDYGPTSFGVQFDQSYFGGAPWDNINGKRYNAAYIKNSPLFDVESLHTPTIIFQGGKDRKVTRDQSWEYYRAIQQVGKAPVRFLWFPGEPHGPRKLTHQLRKIREEIAWFDKYLFKPTGTDAFAYDDTKVVKQGSPLARLLLRAHAARVGKLYGRKINGILAPEVEREQIGGTAIGRFEVTNAQYAAFDSGYSFSPLRANYPITGISLQQALAYTRWLRGKTGRRYRLPDADEARMLQAKARKSAAHGNTLNYWAGYAITLDQAAALREKLTPVRDRLVQPVGSFPGIYVGNAFVYDLGGNVAEMFNNHGKVDVYGYAALSYVDSLAALSKPPADFRGFRVIQTKPRSRAEK